VRAYFGSTGVERELAADLSVTGAAAFGFAGATHEGPAVPGERTLLFRWSQVLHRLNGDRYQASLTSRLGVGYLLSSDHDDRSHAQAGLGFDAETRRWLVAGDWGTGASPGLAPLQRGLLRAGFAPWLAEYRSLQGWVFWEVERLGLHGGSLTRMGPVARLTYRGALVELGYLAGEGRRDLVAAFEVTF
jgi:hypothetical protein